MLKKNHNHFIHRRHRGDVPHERKNNYSEYYTKVLYAGPKHFGKLKPNPADLKSPARLTTLIGFILITLFYGAVNCTFSKSYSFCNLSF